MKTIRIILLLALVCLYLPEVSGQNLVNNPSFETYNFNSACGDNYYICQASGWYILNNTPDVLNSINASVPPLSYSRQPRTGDANARFASPPNGMDEYFYGSTQPLTAGKMYVVSFWVRKDYTTSANISMGMHIGPAAPSPQLLNPYIQTIVPQIVVTPTTTQYVRAYTCFTATASGTHYLTFGAFRGNGTGEGQVWLVDDVSVEEADPTTPLPVADLSIPQTTYCMTDAVIADGSASVNETSHQWDLYQVVNGNEVLKYSSGEVAGQAGTFSTGTITGFFPYDGECYRLYLSTFGVCKDRTSIDFCFMYPSIGFLNNGNPVCEHIPVDLQVTGENGWTYTWSTGQSGVGLKTVSVTPTIGNSTYTVTVTTPQGCTSSKTITLTVSSQNNVAPWMDGINGTGEYTQYVRQGDAVFFNSLLSNDNSNENMLITPDPSNLPTGYIYSLPSQTGGIFSFSWVTSLATPVGEYHYYLTADDQNACITGINTFDFRIIVVCDQCPVCVSYEDRTPANNPLPPETKAGQCIKAGFSLPVSTGTAAVLFQAGESIELGPFFEAGPGFEAVIDPSTCITDCEDCCNDWAGFTYDEFPSPIILNFDDNDPTNDIFQLTDMYHPFCAFGAKGYHLEILRTNASNHLLNSDTGYETTACCAFRSPAPENPIPHSSIWWDGYYTNMWGNQTRAEPQMYVYMIELYGCNGEYLIMHGDIYVQTISNLAANPNGEMQHTMHLAADTVSGTVSSVSDSTLTSGEALGIYPNPATNMLYISGSRAETVTIQLYDEKGRMLTKRETVSPNAGYSLEKFSAGKYYCRIYNKDGTYILKQFIKL
jgi:hypothetical protein